MESRIYMSALDHFMFGSKWTSQKQGEKVRGKQERINEEQCRIVSPALNACMLDEQEHLVDASLMAKEVMEKRGILLSHPPS